MSEELFLTADELVTLTGYRQASKQCAHLKAQRIPYHTNRAGHPKVARAVLEGRKVVEYIPSAVEIWVDLELKKRAKQLGHSVEMFQRTYTKWIDGQRDDAEMGRLEQAISPGLAPAKTYRD